MSKTGGEGPRLQILPYLGEAPYLLAQDFAAALVVLGHLCVLGLPSVSCSLEGKCLAVSSGSIRALLPLCPGMMDLQLTLVISAGAWVPGPGPGVGALILDCFAEELFPPAAGGTDPRQALTLELCTQ